MIGTMTVFQSQPVEVRFPEWGVYLIESHHSHHFCMDWTTHPFLKILFILKGEGKLLVGGRNYRLRANQTAVVPRGVRHRIVDSPKNPLSLYVLCLKNGAVETFCPRMRYASLRTNTPTALGGVVKNILRNLLYEQARNDVGADIVIIGLTLELIGMLIRGQSTKRTILNVAPDSSIGLLSRARVAALIVALDNDFYRHQSVEQAAERIGLRPRRFSQLFREITGSSWPVFLRTKRIAHARHLLLQTNHSIAAVCFECGFEDISSFYRAFQHVERISPMAWRDKMRPLMK